MVTRDGKTALVNFKGTERRIKVGTKEYHFENRRGVSLCWVNNEDVGKVMEYVETCCGGQRTRIFKYANQAQCDYFDGLRN